MALNARELAEDMFAATLFEYPPDEPMSPEMVEMAIDFYERCHAKPIIDHIVANGVVMPGTLSNSGGTLVGTGKIV